jgi:hypothetical protein
VRPWRRVVEAAECRGEFHARVEAVVETVVAWVGRIPRQLAGCNRDRVVVPPVTPVTGLWVSLACEFRGDRRCDLQRTTTSFQSPNQRKIFEARLSSRAREFYTFATRRKGRGRSGRAHAHARGSACGEEGPYPCICLGVLHQPGSRSSSHALFNTNSACVLCAGGEALEFSPSLCIAPRMGVHALTAVIQTVRGDADTRLSIPQSLRRVDFCDLHSRVCADLLRQRARSGFAPRLR